LHRYDPADVVLLFADTGNEHAMTLEHIAQYSRDVHPVTQVQPIVADLGAESPGRRKALGLDDSAPLDLATLAAIKQRFPSPTRRFCTMRLKIAPQKRWLETHIPPTDEYILYAGVRRDESRGRSSTPIRRWDDYFDCELVCPIADWSKQMCFDYIQQHNEPINRLYTLGFNRVGCAPCINSTKGDILAWSQRFPEMIDKVRAWEQAVGKTFFGPIRKGQLNWIDDVVAWAQTHHGGKEISLLSLMGRPACESRYGLCE
jgi:3'-phosphoadenosine 5'-phosphosulfate sulfotransferase (PAPS reductase)/FAD synthetase